MAYRIIRNDIAQVHADVIVNSANPRPICGGSTEAHIYDVAGYDDLLEARQKDVGYLAVGELGVTPAFNLPAKNIIHVSCPWWNEEWSDECIKMLSSCYISAIHKAKELKAKSIAFPLLSSGVYRFPKALAIEVATSAFELYDQDDIEIILVVYDQEAFEAAQQHFPVNLLAQESSKLYESVQSLDMTSEESEFEYCRDEPSSAPIALSAFAVSKKKPVADNPYEQEILEIDRIINAHEESFHDFFMEKLEQWDGDLGTAKTKNAAIYSAANIDRKLFSKIKRMANYVPKKYTVIALGIGLRLGIDDMERMLEAAGCSFNSSKRDLVIKYFLRKRDLYEKHGRIAIHVINDVLQLYHEDILGQDD